MSNATIVTWTSRVSAQERAHDRWGITTLPASEEARHERLMAAIRRLETAEHEDRIVQEQSRYERGDTSYWRNRRDENLRLQNARLQRKIERVRRIRREASR